MLIGNSTFNGSKEALRNAHYIHIYIAANKSEYPTLSEITFSFIQPNTNIYVEIIEQLWDQNQLILHWFLRSYQAKAKLSLLVFGRGNADSKTTYWMYAVLGKVLEQSISNRFI